MNPVTFQAPRQRGAITLSVTDPRTGQLVTGMPPAAILRRIRVTRVVVLVLGTALVAWGTQALGLRVEAALCVFLGLMPVLWVLGWVLGMVPAVSGLSKALRERSASGAALKFPEPEWVRVTIELRDEGVKVMVAAPNEGPEERVTPWREVQLTRVDANGALLHAGPGLMQGIPSTAFAGAAEFDAWCLEVQRRVWEAQRAASSGQP